MVKPFGVVLPNEFFHQQHAVKRVDIESFNIVQFLNFNEQNFNFEADMKTKNYNILD